MALNLITRQEYKSYVGIKSTNEDAFIDEIIPRVSEFVKTYCKRTFVDYMDTPKVEVFHGGAPGLLLAETPVVAVSSVEFSQDYGQTYTPLVEYTDWVVDDYTILPLRDTVFEKRIKGYRVTYTAGYEDVPDSLALAVMDLVTYYRRNESAIKSNKAVGANTVQIEYVLNTNLPAHIRRVLDMHTAYYG